MLLPSFVQAALTRPVRASHKKVVFIQLLGGNDGLNTVIPYQQAAYYAGRPQLGIPEEEVLKVAPGWGFNPAWQQLLPAYEKGQLLVLHNVGYPDTDVSHYHSGQVWRTGCCEGLAANHWLPDTVPVQDCSDKDFDTSLAYIADQINTGNATQVYHAALDGFDTHQFQRVQHDQLLRTYAAGVGRFLQNLHSSGQLNNTLIVTWSEFGRSIKQNIRQGTEHGAGNQVYIFGNQLKQRGIPATDPIWGDEHLPVETDFRRIYATIARQWLGVVSKLDNRFPTMSWL